MEPDTDAAQFLRRHAQDYETVLPLAGYASSRQYFRVCTPSGTLILCRDPEFIESPPGEYPFLIMHRLFNDAGIPVPAIYQQDRENGLLLLEDLGDGLLDSHFPKLSAVESRSLYERILSILARIQSIRGSGDIPFGLAFDTEKLMYEFDFFMEHALRGFFGVNLSDRDQRSLRDEFLKIASLLDRPELFVLNHRDFHSRNIIMKKGAPFIIDFQHARMGLPQYDLVSLLRDDYVRIDETMSESMIEYYWELTRERGIQSMSRDEFTRLFHIMAFQRGVKVVGSFGFQIAQRCNDFYRRYIKITMEYIPGAVSRVGELNVAFRLISPIFEADA